MDIHETTIQFYSMLEAAVEMADEDSLSKKSPLVGDCFEEMAEVSIGRKLISMVKSKIAIFDVITTFSCHLCHSSCISYNLYHNLPYFIS